MDGAILVIAANEKVPQPQTREHFLALQILGIKQMVLVQNKVDLIERSQVDPQEVEILARSLGCKLICTSVKDDVNVNNVFRYLATRCLMEIQKEEQEYMSGNGLHQTYTIGSFGAVPYHNRNSSTTIKLRSGKIRQKKKNIFKNSCVIP